MIKAGIIGNDVFRYPSELQKRIRSIKNDFRSKFSKPWRKFRKAVLVFPSNGKNTSDKLPFLLVRFLWPSKENERLSLATIPINKNKSE